MPRSRWRFAIAVPLIILGVALASRGALLFTQGGAWPRPFGMGVLIVFFAYTQLRSSS